MRTPLSHPARRSPRAARFRVRIGRAVVGGGLLALLGLASCFTERQNEGSQIYAAQCASCHGDQGQGLERLIPPVAASDYVARRRAELPCLIRKGMQGDIVVNGIHYNQIMPGNEGLTDSQITSLLNFLQTNWGNHNQRYTITETSELLGRCNGSDGQ